MFITFKFNLLELLISKKKKDNRKVKDFLFEFNEINLLYD